MPRIIRVVNSALAAAALTSAAACSSSSPSSPQPSPSTASQPAAASPAPPKITQLLDNQQALTSISVRPQQIGAGWKLQPFAQGTEVAGQVTLDLCGGNFASEELRKTRRQTAIVKGQQGFSNEVVGYHTGGAALAAREIRQRSTSCPKGFINSPLAGQPDEKWKIRLLPARPEWLPGTLVVLATVTTADGKSGTSVAIYQFRLNIMSGIYGPPSGNGPSSLLIKAADAAAANLRAAKGA